MPYVPPHLRKKAGDAAPAPAPGRSLSSFEPSGAGDRGPGDRGGRGGRGSGGGGGGGGGRACFNCGETGHISRECPNAAGGGDGPQPLNDRLDAAPAPARASMPMTPRDGGEATAAAPAQDSGFRIPAAAAAPAPKRAPVQLRHGGGRSLADLGQDMR